MRFTFTMSQAVSTLTPYALRKKSPRLRELGVYRLPDGREYVVSTLYSDGCSIYPVHAWGSYGNAEYWADKEGRLLRRGVPSRWSVNDLEDTGKTSAYPKPIIR
jgi:hypothetical protein